MSGLPRRIAFTRVTAIRPALVLIAALSLLSGCATFGGKHETIVVGLAVDIDTGRRLVGEKIEVIDRRPRFQGFGLTMAPVIATTTVGPAGRIQVAVPGRFRRDQLSLGFANPPPPVKFISSQPSHTWRIVDVALLAPGQFAHYRW